MRPSVLFPALSAALLAILLAHPHRAPSGGASAERPEAPGSRSRGEPGTTRPASSGDERGVAAAPAVRSKEAPASRQAPSSAPSPIAPPAEAEPTDDSLRDAAAPSIAGTASAASFFSTLPPARAPPRSQA